MLGKLDSQKHLVVVGGGAAGFFCAINAATLNPNLKVTIIEKSSKVLSKIKVSGGGRCNVTNSCTVIEELIKNYPRGANFLKKAFHWFNTIDTIKWFNERNVTLKTEGDGRVFPSSNSSQTIIDCFLQQINLLKINVLLNTTIIKIEKKENDFIVAINDRKLSANYICFATGSITKSIESLLVDYHLTIEKGVPSLFTFNVSNSTITQLMGISVPEISIKIQGTKFLQQGPILITHWGFSGPAVLKLSAFAAVELANRNYHFNISINWLNSITENDIRENWNTMRQQFSSQKIYAKNPFNLPNRLWQFLLGNSAIKEDQLWATITNSQQNKLLQQLTASVFTIKSKTTFKEEFVTCGGISLNEIDVNTMQSKKHEGLFFAGEILNIDGITGGFNFQNAWTTGYIAAKAIVQKSNQ